MRTNKRAEQIASKKRHKESLTKRRQAEPLLELAEPVRAERLTILIVCEGENTEPSYFRQFRLSSAQIVPVGAGCETIRVVERAKKEQEKRRCDQVWVVFDKDDFPAQDFNAAIEIAENLTYRVAYSNQAFEYWLILHFEDHQGGAMHRDDYHDKLNGYLKAFNLYYDGKVSKVVTKEIFDLLLATDPKTGISRMETAIRRARSIYEFWKRESPAEAESSTMVFRLVEEIKKYF